MGSAFDQESKGKMIQIIRRERFFGSDEKAELDTEVRIIMRFARERGNYYKIDQTKISNCSI